MDQKVSRRHRRRDCKYKNTITGIKIYVDSFEKQKGRERRQDQKTERQDSKNYPIQKTDEKKLKKNEQSLRV